MNELIKITVNSEYFNIEDTLSCGQTFRFKPFGNGFLVFSLDKCAYVYTDSENTVIECENTDKDYFYRYFDLERDYGEIYDFAVNSAHEIVKESAKIGKGIRILNQDKLETLFSFIVSQNNNIPRIKGIIEKLCFSLGEKKNFNGVEYYAFPSAKSLAEKDLEFFYSVGLGYRAPYIKRLAEITVNGFSVESFSSLDTPALKKALIGIYGVGPKVADCVTFFGYGRSDSFPVDTWIEKVYVENFKGKEKTRVKITEWFLREFKNYSGYIQQYLFYYKRSKEKDIKK